MNIGITGASGFIGGRVLEDLIASQQHELRALSRTIHPYQVNPPSRLSWRIGDLSSHADCLDFVEGLDVIIHLAQANNPLSSNRHWPSDASTNLQTSLNLLQAIREKQSCPQVIFASSGGAVYGPSAGHEPFSEIDLCRPMSPYGIQKLAIEHYIRLASEQKWLRGVVLRIANPYGQLLSSERKQGLIGVALNQVLHGQPVTVYSSKQVIRDYIHLDDLLAVFRKIIGGEWPYVVWNAGSGVGHSVEEVLEVIGGVTGRVPECVASGIGAEVLQLNPWSVLNVEKIARDLGWKPQIDLASGIAKMYQAALGGLNK